jgi:hypothetical protein
VIPRPSGMQNRRRHFRRCHRHKRVRTVRLARNSPAVPEKTAEMKVSLIARDAGFASMSET